MTMKLKKYQILIIVLFLVGAIVSISEGHIVGALIGVFASLSCFGRSPELIILL